MQSAFNKAFQTIFKNGLESYGFSPLKSSNIFVRVMNKELMQFIYPQHINAASLGIFSFSIEAAVRTIYVPNISCAEIKSSGRMLHYFLNVEERTSIPWQNYCFCYNDSNVEDVLKEALEKVVRLILPVYDRIQTLSDYIEHSLLTNQVDLSFQGNNPESLVWIAAKDQIDHDALAKAQAPILKELYKYCNGYEPSECELLDYSRQYLQEKYLDPLNRIVNDPEKYSEAVEKMKQGQSAVYDFLERNGVKIP